jgi:hypothetical protein
MATGDINGDGKADIVAVEHEASGHYSYVRGISNGSTFSWGVTNLTGMNFPVKMSVGDINGDGKADIVGVEREASGLYAYVRGISNGSTFSWAATNLTGMNFPVKMSVGDINGDGKADIVWVEREASGLYSYLRGISNGSTFSWGVTSLTRMNHAQKMSVGDINGDGKADITSVETY